ncbi:Uncharacterised protein [Mycobacteroides abscessus subsp. abscessus]|nr:Uncharacterised protein [Mycobacteroides abscessus subsp. abscessus]
MQSHPAEYSQDGFLVADGRHRDGEGERYKRGTERE